MKLTDLKPADGAKRKTKRVGRGRASGHGKTSTRGHNGQGQRSGEGKRFGFEGGQTPLFRRLPKIHNFDGPVKGRQWVLVNVGSLNEFACNSEVDVAALVARGILRKSSDSLRILGNGELNVALKVSAHHISCGAKNKIEQAGGSVTIIEAATPTRKHRVKKIKNPADPARNPVKEKAKDPAQEPAKEKGKEKSKGSKEPAKAQEPVKAKAKAKDPAKAKAKAKAKDHKA